MAGQAVKKIKPHIKYNADVHKPTNERKYRGLHSLSKCSMTRHKFRFFWGLSNFSQLEKLNFNYEEGLEEHEVPATCFIVRKNIRSWLRVDTQPYTLGRIPSHQSLMCDSK